MSPIVGIADSQDAVHRYLDTHATLYHGKLLASGAYVFAVVPRDGALEIFAALDADPAIATLPSTLDTVLSDATLLKKLAKVPAIAALASKGATARDLRTYLHGLAITHLFDPRLG